MTDRMPTEGPDNLNGFTAPDVQVEQYPSPENPVVPHSGHAGVEKPIREFDNTTLEDAHAQGLLVTPESPAGLPAIEAPRTSRTKKFVAGGLLAAVGIAGVAIGVSKMTGGGESTDAPNREPVASATPNPGETPTGGTETEAPASLLENLDNKPTEAQVQEALQPITTEDYPTPEAALARMGQIWSVLVLGGEVDLDAHQETPDSAVEREALLENLMYDRAPMQSLYDLRNNMGHELYFPNDDIMWKQTWKSTGVSESIDGTYTGEVAVETITSIPDYDAGYQVLFSDMVPHQISYHPVSLIEVDGIWKLIEIEPATSIEELDRVTE